VCAAVAVAAGERDLGHRSTVFVVDDDDPLESAMLSLGLPTP
jgi:hypothetical protein